MAGRTNNPARPAARPWFSVRPAALARALARLATEDALSLPLLDAAARRRLTAATSRLPFRAATPVIGEGANAVYQQFDLCMPIPGGSLFHDFAAALEALVNKALAGMPTPPLARPFRFNDLIVQRYERGALGITAHRDHRRYEGLIALVSLSGAARFFVCADRAGHEAREVPAPPGSLVLMRGPGYAGRTDRPFHFVRDIGRRRLSLGLRHDANAAGMPASRPMKTADFDFELPRALIAQHPAVPRDAARLLLVGEADLADRRIRDLPALLSPGDLLVCNDTRVIPTRLFGRRGEVKIEATLHRRETSAAGGGTGIRWRAFARPARRLRPGDRVDFAADFHATVVKKGDGGEVTLAIDLNEAGLAAALQRHGAMPLPPYIARARGGDPRDRRDYQTIFAAHDGAVAAPTAGLHFTPDLLRALADRGIARTAVTLHVGAGTFLPVTADDPRRHRMHAEVGEVAAAAAEAINTTREAGGRVVAVGSTALRLLETAADAQGRVKPFTGETDIFILPGYRFRAVDRLLTNFHLPRSTLFMLVCAFAGMERMQRAYAHAIEHGYRFYSYGDACLLARAAE